MGFLGSPGSSAGLSSQETLLPGGGPSPAGTRRWSGHEAGVLWPADPRTQPSGHMEAEAPHCLWAAGSRGQTWRWSWECTLDMTEEASGVDGDGKEERIDRMLRRYRHVAREI